MFDFFNALCPETDTERIQELMTSELLFFTQQQDLNWINCGPKHEVNWE